MHFSFKDGFVGDVTPVKGVTSWYIEEVMNSWVTDPLTFPHARQSGQLWVSTQPRFLTFSDAGGFFFFMLTCFNRNEPSHTPTVSCLCPICVCWKVPQEPARKSHLCFALSVVENTFTVFLNTFNSLNLNKNSCQAAALIQTPTQIFRLTRWIKCYS